MSFCIENFILIVVVSLIIEKYNDLLFTLTLRLVSGWRVYTPVEIIWKIENKRARIIYGATNV